jgi:hypothetical protein
MTDRLPCESVGRWDVSSFTVGVIALGALVRADAIRAVRADAVSWAKPNQQQVGRLPRNANCHAMCVAVRCRATDLRSSQVIGFASSSLLGGCNTRGRSRGHDEHTHRFQVAHASVRFCQPRCFGSFPRPSSSCKRSRHTTVWLAGAPAFRLPAAYPANGVPCSNLVGCDPRVRQRRWPHCRGLSRGLRSDRSLFGSPGSRRRSNR